MSRELEAALKAIAGNGGPIHLSEVGVTITMRGSREYIAGIQHWDAHDNAVLIAALKADIRHRDCTVDSYEYKSGLIEVTITSPEPFKAQMHSVTEMHKDEGTAHALAWLSAFGGGE